MTIKPILFSGPMVRAILEGRKIQTRRVIKPQPPTEKEWLQTYPDDFIPYNMGTERDESGQWWWNNDDLLGRLKVPNAIGDLLYVREAWRTWKDYDKQPPRNLSSIPPIFHEADRDSCDRHGKFRQGIHMPRWASRITLKVTEVRVQRLQDMSRSDARSEGIITASTAKTIPQPKAPFRIIYSGDDKSFYYDPISAFEDLWDSINATRNDGEYAWAKNPWVAAYTFEVIKRNVDQIGGE